MSQHVVIGLLISGASCLAVLVLARLGRRREPERPAQASEPRQRAPERPGTAAGVHLDIATAAARILDQAYSWHVEPVYFAGRPEIIVRFSVCRLCGERSGHMDRCPVPRLASWLSLYRAVEDPHVSEPRA